MTLTELLKDSAYKLTQFNTAQIQALENRIIIKQVRDKATPYIVCLVRGKEIKLTPEEVVRQLYLMVLIDELKYPIDRIAIEYGVTFGRETKRADICIFDKDRPTVPYILVELKKPKLKDGKEQLKSYCNATGAPIGVWSNGDSISYYQRKDPNYFEDIPRIPSALEKLSDVLSARWTIDDLISLNKLVTEKKSLKDLILEMEDEVLANAGVDVFEELFKLIFTKLYDEMEGWRDRKKHLVFRNYGDTETELKAKIQDLFDKARDKWEGVFTDDAKLQLTPSHLSVCIASLESVMLFNSNLDVVDEAFEYLINKSSKGEKGQYFTPRYVIDMCVKMLNPQEHETLIDTAAGSCGFPVHGIFHVWEAILKSEGLTKSHLFTAEQKPPRCIDYVQNKVFAIDFDEKAVRVGRTLNLIAGDGQTNVLHLNTLDYERWDEKTNDDNWRDIYGEGWKKLRKLRTDKNSNRDFQFDVLMANPPFAGDIKESRILAKYELGKKDNGKYQTSVGRDILFIERNLNFLKAGGRMAVVLPQGRFNNSSDKQIREFIAGHCRILAVVGLHGNVFKPHTGTKTSVLLVQKWDDTLCPKVDDYPIFFATMQEYSKDNSGDKIYVAQADGSPLLDTHEHLIVKHDLFNHDGLTQDGIAEAFIEFAKKENLSFFDLDLRGFKNLAGLYAEPFNEVKYLALLERLEISILMLSEVSTDNKNLRYDAEYFKKVYLNFFKDVKSLSPLSEFVENGYRVVYETTDIVNKEDAKKNNYPIFLQATDLETPFIKTDNLFYVHEKDWIRYPKGRIEKGEILIEVKGKIEKVVIVPDDFPEKALVTGSLYKMTVNQKINKHYLLTYLICKYGVVFKERYKTNLLISFISKDDLYNIPVPIFSVLFQNKIESVFNLIFKYQKESKNLYSQAETLLLNALGVADFSPSTEKVNIKSFKDSFIATGRLDAEYYQPKYDELEHKIKNYIPSRSHMLRGNECSTVPAVRDAARLTLHSHAARGNEEKAVLLQSAACGNEESGVQNHDFGFHCFYLSDLVSIQKSIETGSDAYSDKGLPYLRVSNINKFGITAPDIHISESYYQANKMALDKLKPKKNTILLSKDGSVGIAYKLTDDFNGLTSGALLHLTVKNQQQVLPDYLTLLLNSFVVQLQAERDAGGSIILHWRISEIANALIPIIDMAIQTKIAELIQQSFTLKAQSEQLLATAKRAVELAIETNEQTALNYMCRKLENKNATAKFKYST